MMSGAEGEMVGPEARRGSLRASHADRNLVIDTLKTAFVQGRLTKDELDARVGRTLAARTYDELAEVTADIPAGSNLARPPQPAPAPRPVSWAASRPVKSGVGAIAAMIFGVSVTAAALGQPAAGVVMAVFIVMLAAAASAFVGSVVGAVLMIESRHRKRSHGRFPTRPGSGPDGQASQRPHSAGPAGPFPPVDPGDPYTAEATRGRGPSPQLPGAPLRRRLEWAV
jgi:Domain of unknown function (DUF1707)